MSIDTIVKKINIVKNFINIQVPHLKCLIVFVARVTAWAQTILLPKDLSMFGHVYRAGRAGYLESKEKNFIPSEEKCEKFASRSIAQC